MTTTSRRFVLEVLVDTITINDLSTKESILAGDVRLSFALSDFPVVHIKPSPAVPNDTPLRDKIAFGGSGKLCEFSMKKPELESSHITVLFLKEISTIKDHLILCMTAPIPFQQLLLSLPSCSPQPFVKRRFEFIDNRGSCELFLRISTIDPTPIRRTTAARVVAKKLEISSEKPPSPVPMRSRSKINYGGFKNRPSIIH